MDKRDVKGNDGETDHDTFVTVTDFDLSNAHNTYS